MSMYEEYRVQLKKINKMLQEKVDFNQSLVQKYEPLTKEISDLNYLKSNLELYVKWHDKAHEPDVFEGIDNLSACKSYKGF